MKKHICLKHKFRGKKAFTVAELMIAMLIMSFAGLIVLGGLAVVSNSFHDMVLRSQTQMVLKEYMGEIRSGFLSADLDSELEIDSNDQNRPAFTHSGYGCAGYYTVVRQSVGSGAVAETEIQPDNSDPYGTVVFQPVYVNYETKKAEKYINGENKKSIPLVSTKLSDDFMAKVEYKFDPVTQLFEGTVTVKSVRALSSGQIIELSGTFSVSPAGRPAETGGS